MAYPPARSRHAAPQPSAQPGPTPKPAKKLRGGAVPPAPPAAATPPKDVLDMLADGPVLDVLALVLWKDRHRNPDMTVLIREEDIKGFSDCTTYLKLKPAVRIVRPKGAPAMPAVAATRTRSAVPARPAEPPRPWVVVGVVEAGTENIIKPIENSEAGALLRDQADAVRRARERAPMLAQQLLADATAGVFSTAMIHEAAQALTALARA